MNKSIESMSKQELAEYVKLLQKGQAIGTKVTLTEKGGIYIRSDQFIETSKAGKEYKAGINMGKNTARALFGNKEILEQVIAEVDKLTN